MNELPRTRSGTFEETHARNFIDVLSKVTLNEFFRKEDFRNHNLLLCESFSLLWQNTTSPEKWKNLERNEAFNQGTVTGHFINFKIIQNSSFHKHLRG